MGSEMKALAKKYFEGKISPEDEKALFDYLAQDSEALATFRSWEAEWASRPHFDMVTESAWTRFCDWMCGAEARRQRRPMWRVAAAAAVVLLMLCSAFVGWYATSLQPEHYYTLTAPMGSKTRLSLPDGSLVWLNAGSSLRYSNRFGDNNRRVVLEGQGYFEVAKRDGAEFVVNTRGYDVVVKGTRFDISAYNDDKNITTTLLQGKVVIDRGADRLTMEPGDMVSLNVITGKFSKSRYTTDHHAWVQGMTEFSEISLEDLAKLLSRRYAVNITITSERLRKMEFAISLRNKETIDDVLDALQSITSMQVCRDGKEITIGD